MNTRLVYTFKLDTSLDMTESSTRQLCTEDNYMGKKPQRVVKPCNYRFISSFLFNLFSFMTLLVFTQNGGIYQLENKDKILQLRGTLYNHLIDCLCHLICTYKILSFGFVSILTDYVIH